MSFDTFSSAENPYRESPFRSEYVKGDSMYEEDNLYEPDFNDFVQDLFEEAQASIVNAAESLIASQSFSPNGEDSVINGFVNQHYTQLAPSLEQSIEDFSNYLGQNISPDYDDATVFGIIDNYEPLEQGGVWGWIKKKAKSVVKKVKKIAKKAWKKVKKFGKKAWKLAKKLNPLRWIFNKLKKVIRPLLKAVLKRALNLLPRKYRGLARKIMRKLGISGYVGETQFDPEEFEESSFGSDSSIQVAGLVDEFDLESEKIIEEGDSIEYNDYDEGYAGNGDIEGAIQRYAIAIRNNGPNNVGPQTDEFVGVVLTALRLGVRIIGRKRVMKFLSRAIAKLISRWVGKDLSRPLAKAAVKAGFKLLNLEAPSSQEHQVSQFAAAIIADTAEQLASVPDEMLEDDATAQAFVNEALTNAIANYI